MTHLIQLASDVYLARDEVAGVYVEKGFIGADAQTWYPPTTWIRLRGGGVLKSDWELEAVVEAVEKVPG